jgi:hypothetical protein
MHPCVTAVQIIAPEWPNGADVDPDTLYEEAHRTLTRG